MMTKKIIGAGILAIDKHSGKILLDRRGMKGDDPNTWTTFGGTFEESDGIPKTTAKREFWEETKVDVPYEMSKTPFYVSGNQFLDFYTYIGIFDGQFDVTICDESLGYGWYDLENMPDNLHPGFQDLIDDKMDELLDIRNEIMSFNH